MGNEHKLVEAVNHQTLIKLVKFLKRRKAPSPDTIHNEVLRLGTTTSLFNHLAKLFTSSIQLGYIPTAWNIATLHMLLKVLGQSPPQTKPPNKNPQTKTPKDKNPQRKIFVFHFIKVFMVSQVHNLLIVQWLQV